jgi:hypothetical protein
MLDKYIKMNDRPIVVGQDARTKEWYTKEIVANTPDEADTLMGIMDSICNKHNPSIEKKENIKKIELKIKKSKKEGEKHKP